MIDRIYVSQKVKDNRERNYLKAFESLGLSGKLRGLKILDGYLFSHELDRTDLENSARILTNPVSEAFFINKVPFSFDFAIEIGFLPGVTDNVGHTAKETVADMLLLKDSPLDVYTSKVFLISGIKKPADAKKIAASLYNPLIERAYIGAYKEVKKTSNLPLWAPEVNLSARSTVLSIPLLDMDNAELAKVGKEGILDKGGKRRGPLALGLPEMETIKNYFDKLGRNPTDIELESLAQTWSEHCKHAI